MSFLAPIKHHPMISYGQLLWGEASASGRNWLPNGFWSCRSCRKCLQFPMAESLADLALGTWHWQGVFKDGFFCCASDRGDSVPLNHFRLSYLSWMFHQDSFTTVHLEATRPGKHTKKLWKITIYSGFSHETWWFSIVFCMLTRPGISGYFCLIARCRTGLRAIRGWSTPEEWWSDFIIFLSQ